MDASNFFCNSVGRNVCNSMVFLCNHHHHPLSAWRGSWMITIHHTHLQRLQTFSCFTYLKHMSLYGHINFLISFYPYVSPPFLPMFGPTKKGLLGCISSRAPYCMHISCFIVKFKGFCGVLKI